MEAGQLNLLGRGGWRFRPSGAAGIVVAERAALGTTARVAVWPARAACSALVAVDDEIERLDRSASRFRPDSELAEVHRRAGHRVRVSDDLAEAIRVALAAADWTGGLADPTVGQALIALGYDRDFAAVPLDSAETVRAARVPGWHQVRLDGNVVRIASGVRVDLGATAKGLGSDRAARAAGARCAAGGVLVSLGGDMAIAGTCPAGGWPVLIADDDRQLGAADETRSVQQVRLHRGAVATSSIGCRRWRRAGKPMHHIVDPRTGEPAAGPWRTVTVAAANCAEANAASTAAVILGACAPGWLSSEGLPARLVRHDGRVTLAGGWPEAEDGVLEPPPARMSCRRAAPDLTVSAGADLP